MKLDAKKYENLHKKFLYLSTRREENCCRQRSISNKNSEHMYKNDETAKKKLWNKKIQI
jgi:hypothetical protein